MKKIKLLPFMLLLFLLILLCSPFSAQALDDPNILADAALLVNAENDLILYAKNADQKAYPASITKVMTAFLVLEAVERGDFSLDDIVIPTSAIYYDQVADGSTQNIKAGEEISIRDLLYCILVASANEACNALAEAVSGGDIVSFIERMNTRAAELGSTNTHFKNTHGLHNEDHYTTAHDIYLLAREAMKNKTFAAIVATDEYTVPATNLHEERHFYNTNYLLSNKRVPGYVYQYATGIKTGSTGQAGHCLVSMAEKEGTALISVILGAEIVTKDDGTVERHSFSESRRLLEWGFNNFSLQQILDPSTPVQEIPVTLSEEADYVLVQPASGLDAILPNDFDLDLFEQTIVLPETIEAPVFKDQVLGTITLTYDGKEYGTVDLIALNDVARSELLYRTQQIKEFLAMPMVQIGVLVVFLFILILIIAIISGARRRHKNRYRGSRKKRY